MIVDCLSNAGRYAAVHPKFGAALAFLADAAARPPEQGRLEIEGNTLYADDPAVWFTIHPGTFVVFFPWNAHAPMVSSGTVRKIVVKVPR